MIQFNLLPDVKINFINARRTKRLIVSVSVIVSVAALVILIALISVVDVLQKAHLNSINGHIKTDSATVENTPDLSKLLTIQNQLQSLPSLDSQKPEVSRLFGYLSQLTPNNVSLSSLSIDFQQDTLTIQGSAPNIAVVDQFVDTLKFTTYNVNSGTSAPNAFNNVVLSAFSIGGSSTSPNASLTITANFAPDIFNSSDIITLTVPDIISTRSETQQPQNLFTGPTSH